jgi:carnitine O-acetyltransferase
MAPKRRITTDAKIVEDNTVGPMYRFETSLPYLPVPTLQSISLKYLESVKPLVSPEAYEKTKSVVTEFIASPQAAELQRRLEARAEEPGRQNWLAEWWNEAAYMGYRDPVVVFVSYFYVHLQDKVQQTQARKAAELLRALMPFRELVEM